MRPIFMKRAPAWRTWGKTRCSQGGKAARGGDVDGEKLVMSALDLGSYLSKIPVGPVTRRARRGYEQWQEGEGTPLSVIMPRAN